MSRKYRIFFLALFSIFFIVTSPFLALYSLGYELNVKQRELTNSISITVDSRPRTADVYSGDGLVLRNSGELRAGSDQLIPLSVRQNGYLTEDFLIWSGDNENTTARITNLWMLPTSSESIDSNSSVEYISLLSKDLVIIKKNSEYFVQLYSFGGLQSNPELISNVTALPVQIPANLKWDLVSTNAFWNKENELILVKSGDQWILYDTRYLIADPAYLGYINSTQILVLDKKKNVWIWNYATNQFRFLDSGFDGLSYTEIPNYLWLWKYDTIYRVSPNQINEQIQLEDYVFGTNQSIATTTASPADQFVIKSVYQGIFIKINTMLVYIPDYNKVDWYILARDVRDANAFENSIIWLDQKNQIWVYNLQLKHIENVAKLDNLSQYEDSSITIFYYFLWRRIVIYTPVSVQTIWYDKDILNTSIEGYYSKNWITGIQCHTELIDRYQFCIQDGNLVAYKNTSIW